jgi:hypothetical protein
MGPQASHLLRRVAARRAATDAATAAYFSLLALAAAFTLFIVASRLTGLAPDLLSAWALVALPPAALLAGVLFRRRLTRREVARLVDGRAGTHDLFLTTVTIETAPGEYRPLVDRDAEAEAAGITPAEVVPFRLGPRARNAVAALAAPLVAVLVLPQLDPFGRQEERDRLAERRKRVEDGARATRLRKALLQKARETGTSKELKRLQVELRAALDKMRPKERKANLRRLEPVQKELGRLWRELSRKKLSDALRRAPASQRFGAGGGRKLSEWKRGLRSGRTAGPRKELGELKELARRLSEARDPAARERLRRELRRRLRRLSEFARTGAGSEALQRALARAAEELELSGVKGLAEEATKALQESLDLSEQEVTELARSLRELQRLEDSLEAAQLAKALNELGRLDGRACGSCTGIADYAALYRSLLEQAGGSGRGAGPGMRGPGTGRGGQAPEDETQKTDFKSELSRSAMTAGKMLMQWKTKGLGRRGRAREDFRESVGAVKQAYQEAILREQIPPNYHEAIKRYFDSIEEAVDESGGGPDAGAGE